MHRAEKSKLLRAATGEQSGVAAAPNVSQHKPSRQEGLLPRHAASDPPGRCQASLSSSTTDGLPGLCAVVFYTARGGGNAG
eukprot:1215753-Pleurochrysis_carterae.AAC.1